MENTANFGFNFYVEGFSYYVDVTVDLSSGDVFVKMTKSDCYDSATMLVAEGTVDWS